MSESRRDRASYCPARHRNVAWISACVPWCMVIFGTGWGLYIPFCLFSVDALISNAFYLNIWVWLRLVCHFLKLFKGCWGESAQYLRLIINIFWTLFLPHAGNPPYHFTLLLTFLDLILRSIHCSISRIIFFPFTHLICIFVKKHRIRSSGLFHPLVREISAPTLWVAPSNRWRNRSGVSLLRAISPFRARYT